MNESYEEYIRSILGYPRTDFSCQNINYQNYNDMNYYSGFGSTNSSDLYSNYYTNSSNNFETRNKEELEKCYPEIYKLVYPMVLKKCQDSRAMLTAGDIENMTDEIYFALENKEGIELNINLTNNVSNSMDMNSANTNEKRDKLNNKAEVKIKESTEKRETRQINRGLRDLIKILLLRELLNRPRPPMPAPPPPPRPPMPGPRPPMRPRYNQNDLELKNPNMDIYEQF